MKISLLKVFSIFSLFCCVGVSLSAQVEFCESSSVFEPSNHAIGIADVNGDFRDDIISLKAPRNIDLYIQTQNKGLVRADEVGNVVGNWDWMVLLGDYANSGYKSIVSSGAYNTTFITDYTDLRDFSVEINPIPSSNMFAQGANNIDVNQDGFLDVFICHDDADSRFFINDGNGNFTRDNSIIDFSLDPAYDGSGNYGSIWTYINGDDLLDLYIAKCRLGATSTEDPRRINQVYLQNEDGSFTRQKELGLDVGWQSWAADFGDVDNDGDLDAFVVNHDHHHQLFENQGDSLFVEVESFTDLALNSFDIQGIIEDFDNNGFVDFLIVGARNTMVWNFGNFDFAIQDNILEDRNAYSAATGDVNNDGFIDVFASYPGGLVQNDNNPSKLFVNQKNDNNYLAISLHGIESNREGVGARLICYSSLGQQTRVVSAGEGYGIFNSLTSRFGLHQDQLIDSLEIRWPSGLRQVIYDLQTNRHIVVTEGLGYKELLAEFSNDAFNVCEGGELVLENPNQQTALWNQIDQTEENLVVTQSGFYYATATDSSGCVSASPTIFAMSAEEELEPTILAPVKSACVGDTIMISALDNVINWSNGSTETDLLLTESGQYFYEAQGVCDTVSSDTIQLDFLSGVNLKDEVVELEIGDVLNIELADVNTYQWSFKEDFSDIVFEGPVYVNDMIEKDTSLYVRNMVELGERDGEAGLNILIDENFVDFDFQNVGMNFTVYEPLVINSMRMTTDIAGPRVLLVQQGNDTIYSQELLLQNGLNTLAIGLELDPGEYTISTSELANLALTGFPGPILSRTFNVTFPISVDEALSIDGTTDNGNTYYYFYDWDLTVSGGVCFGETGRYDIEVRPSSSYELKQAGIFIYPNPVSDLLMIELLEAEVNVVLYDVNGNKVLQKNLNDTSNRIDLSQLPSALYFLQLHQNGQTYMSKILKK